MASKQEIKVGTVAITTGSKHWGCLNDGLTVVVLRITPGHPFPYWVRRIDGQRLPVVSKRLYAFDEAQTEACRLIPVDPDGTDDQTTPEKIEVIA